jgi:hypothetical protein
MVRVFPSHRAGTPAAFTLVELLVASTIALVVMGAVASLFGIFSRTSTNTQAIVDLSSRMRSTANRLRLDLAGLTAPLAPPLNPESDSGYFELIEGPAQDGLATSGSGTLILQSGTAVWASGTTSLLADTDDALVFTTRSSGSPFEGNYNGSQIESSTAEVAWFCRPSVTQPVPGLQLQTLYRRQLLVISYVGAAPFFVAGSSTNNQVAGTIPAIYGTYDISLRSDPAVAGALVPNTLGDLTRRECRFWHNSLAFPYTFQAATLDNATFNGTLREGEDVVLTNVIAFDVRVYDPDALARTSGSTIVYPHEQSYTTTLPSAGFTGCFLDLGCSGTAATTVLTGTGNPKSRLTKTVPIGTATYDTWSTHYESNGIDDDVPLDGIIDDATNGADDDGDNTPDDSDETETAPPYSRPLQAIEIRIRCYDPTSREIRQTTVRHTFTN